LTAADIRAVADMRMLTFQNSVPIEVTSTKPIEIVRWTPESLLVNLEDIRTLQTSVQHQVKGAPREPYVVGDIHIEPNIVVITGPESQINRIKSVVVPIEMDDDVVNDLILDIRPSILDEHGNEIPKVSLNMDSVKVTVRIDKEKTIPIVLDTVGEVPEDYILTNFSYQPKTIQIAGREAEIDAITQLVLEPIDISELTESQQITMQLNEFIPEGMKINSATREVTVDLEVERAVEKTLNIPIKKIDVRYLPRDLQFRYLTEDEDSIRLTLRGRESQLANINVDTVNARIILSQLEPGQHEINIDFLIPIGVEIVGAKPTVNIQLEESPLEEELDDDTQEIDE
jgi:YbbR domain-containing protein